MSDLIERLRLQAEIGLFDAANTPGHKIVSYDEAADEIERLTAECKALREDRDEYRELLRIEHVMASAQNGIVNSVWDILGRDEASEGGSNLVGRVKQLADRATAAEAELESARALLAQYEQAPVVGWITDDGSVFTTDEVKANTWKHSFGLSVIPLIGRPEAKP